jgi:hypothetical protein
MSLSSDDILSFQDRIKADLFALGYVPHLEKIDMDLLKLLFAKYDEYFFENFLSQHLEKAEQKLVFKLSHHSTKSLAGKCSQIGNTYMLYFPTKIFLNLFNNNENSILVNGIAHRDRLSCFLCIFEHELIHLYMYLNGDYKKKGDDYSSHGKCFQDLAYKFFLHTDTRHFLTSGDVAKWRRPLKAGEMVTFTYRKKTYSGSIVKIHKHHVRVMCDDGLWDVAYPHLKSEI